MPCQSKQEGDQEGNLNRLNQAKMAMGGVVSEERGNASSARVCVSMPGGGGVAALSLSF